MYLHSWLPSCLLSLECWPKYAQFLGYKDGVTVAGIRRRFWLSGPEMVELHLVILKVTLDSLPGIRSALSFGEARHVHTDLAVCSPSPGMVELEMSVLGLGKGTNRSTQKHLWPLVIWLDYT